MQIAPHWLDHYPPMIALTPQPLDHFLPMIVSPPPPNDKICDPYLYEAYKCKIRVAYQQ